MQKCYKVIFCNNICQEFDILVLVLYSFDRSLWISTFVCLSVCLHLSHQTLTIAGLRLLTVCIGHQVYRNYGHCGLIQHRIEMLYLIPVVMCNVSWISLHFSSPKPLLKIQTIQQVLVFADVHEIII